MNQQNSSRETIVDLNTADSEDLAKIPGIGADKAWDLIQHRPYRNWDDVRHVPGLDQKAVDVLRESGAYICP